MGINGENLNHLRFADDIVLISDNLEKTETLHVRLTSASMIVPPFPRRNSKRREAMLPANG